MNVYGVPLAGSGGGLRGLQQRRGIDAYPLGNDGLGPWDEEEEAPVGEPLGDVHVHQVEEVSRIGVEFLAPDGLPPFLLFFVAAEGGAFVLQEAHGCFMGSCGVWVAAVILRGPALWVCLLAGEYPCHRGRSSPGHVRRVAPRYRVNPGGEPCLLVRGGGGIGGVIVDGDEVQQGPWSVEGCRAAVPARAWYALVIVSHWWYVCLRGGVCWGQTRGHGAARQCG